jgi:ABC-type branched-subunit amino acid transport system ATPase component
VRETSPAATRRAVAWPGAADGRCGLRRQGTTILLVEQNALRALEIADRAYVLETGQILLTGSGDDLLHNPAVRRAYLGG